MTEFFDDEANVVRAAGYDRPVGDPKQSRSVVLAKHGIVATSHPLAAETGLDILKAGGNAADAAIAASAMIGLVEPMSCGIGGDLFAIYWDNNTQKLYGLNASGRSPINLSREEFVRLGHEQIPTYGPLAWSVPGCVSGWQQLHDRFGSKPFDELLGPSIETAEEGFPVSEVIASSWRGATSKLKQSPDSAATYLVDRERAPRFGELFRNPSLAQSYRRIATDGPEAFYQGDIAKTIVAFSEANGGFFSRDDFLKHEAEWVDPVSTSYRGYELWELPPNGQGIAALQILNSIEPFDVKAMGFGSPDYLHLFIEAKKLAFADRAKFYADPAFNALPTAELISKQYAARQVQRINMNKAATDVPAGDPKLANGDTIYLTVVDKDRNCCSFIQSNYYGFGSQIVPGDVGFVLQNRGALFTLEEGHLNVYEPRKRPFHTIIPAMLTKDGEPYFCFGVMGGDMQPQGHAQVAMNLIDFGMNVQAAGDAARVRHVGSAQPTGVAANGSGTVQVESGISDETVEALRAKGHQVVRAKGAFGGYQGIMIDRKNGVLHGATEARKDGAAVGY
ncbi:MAG: gamma-glutamyltransferase [Planctomycetes bacterium]|nr:gamma-glutamyltransferase [Planctomycetota bacterium]